MNKRILVLCLMGSACFGQTPPNAGQEQFRQIVTQMQALQINLATDKGEILPGERLCVTAEVLNPRETAILGLAPFHPRSSRIALFEPTTDEERKQGLGNWKPVSADRDHWADDLGDPMAGREVAWIGAGERLSRTACLTSNPSNGTDSLPTPLVYTALLKPGRYKLHWSYGRGAEVEFEIIRSQGIVAWAASPLREAEQFWKRESSASRECLGIMSAAIRTSSTTIIVTSESGVKDVCAKPTGTQDADLLRTLAPFIRVTEVPEGVQSLSLQPIGDGTVQLLWEDGRGYRHREIRPRPQFPHSERAR